MDLKLELTTYKHPRWGCSIIVDEVLDIDPLFFIRDIRDVLPNGKDNLRRFCLYFVRDGRGRIVYIGEGLYWDVHETTYSNFMRSRPFNHKQNKKGTELLVKYIQEGWSIDIVSYGLTKLEGRILEALFIRNEINKGKTLSLQGSTEWDGDSLMNKNHGMSDTEFKKYSEMYLNKIEWKSLKIFY